MRHVYSLFVFILIFTAIGCGKSDENSYAVSVTKQNYLISTWRAETEKNAIIPARKLLESISMKPKTSPPAVVSEIQINPSDMLPKNNEVKDWNIAEKIRTYTPDNLFEFHLSRAKVYEAYNFVSLATAEYLNVKLGT